MTFGLKIKTVLLALLILAAAIFSAPKTILYLGGGAYSPWYSLGVLYAVRDYRIPVDSVVGISWGAYVGALWSLGFELDAIQRLVTDSNFVSHILTKNIKEDPLLDLPISYSGTPSIALRYAFFGDSLGFAHFQKKSLSADTAFAKRAIFRFQVEESLLRTGAYVVPFTALACEKGVLKPSTVKASLSYSETAGENCPTFVPKDSSVAIYVVAYPQRGIAPFDSPQATAGFESVLEQIRLQKEDSTRNLVVVRPHSLEASPLMLMQAGYAGVEKKLGELTVVLNEPKDRPVAKDSILPRFKIDPSFDKFPAAYYANVSLYWNEADTGMTAPSNFLNRISESLYYDSVLLAMDTVGVASVTAKATPILEFRVGGMGDNILGPLAYAGTDFRYVNQFEYAFSLDGYVGEHSFAIRPSLTISGMFAGRGGVSVAGNIFKWEPLKSYFAGLDKNLRIFEIRENDVTLSFNYKDSLGNLQVSVLLGEADFKTALEEEMGKSHVNSLAPNVSFVRNQGNYEEWFGNSGYRLRCDWGLRSVNLAAMGTGDAPLYFSSTVDAQMEFAPLSILAFGIGVAGGVNIRRESGYGYVYPKDLEAFPETIDIAVSNWYRLHPALSPWTAEWNFAETSSHHYGIVRANAGLHKGVLGAWIFVAYMRDFEENPSVNLDADRLLFEPMFRFAYRSLDIRTGMSRLVSLNDFDDFKQVKNYNYFFQVGSVF